MFFWLNILVYPFRRQQLSCSQPIIQCLLSSINSEFSRFGHFLAFGNLPRWSNKLESAPWHSDILFPCIKIESIHIVERTQNFVKLKFARTPAKSRHLVCRNNMSMEQTNKNNLFMTNTEQKEVKVTQFVTKWSQLSSILASPSLIFHCSHLVKTRHNV